MPEDNSHSLVPKPSGELSVGSGAERILSEMARDVLKIHQGGLIKTPEPGTLIWEFEMGDMVPSSPAIGSDGTVYVGSHDKKLYAIKADTFPLRAQPWPPLEKPKLKSSFSWRFSGELGRISVKLHGNKFTTEAQRSQSFVSLCSLCLCGGIQASNSFTTFPCTSVSRKSRPAWR